MKRSISMFTAAAAAAACATLAAFSSAAGAAVIGATVADASSGDYTLTSVSVTRGSAGTFTYLPSQLIGVDLTDVDAFQTPLLVPNGASLPPSGTRAALLEDGRLDTGVVNITTTNASPDRSVEVTFATPVVNSDGEDILLFESGGDDAVRFWINDNRNPPNSADLTTDAYSFPLISGMPHTVYSYNNADDRDINSLEELESEFGWSSGTNIASGSIRAMGLDLSLVGVAPGASINSLRFQSISGLGGRVDPVMIVGLPAVPEPTGMSIAGILAGAALLRRSARQ